MKRFFLLAFILNHFTAIAQFTDRYWTFGDSAAIDFINPTSPQPATSVIRARGSCVSICDSIGNLLFYAACPNMAMWQVLNQTYLGYVLNKNHQLMESGDTLVGAAWYQEMIIIPDPGNINRFYLFQGGITSTTNPGLFYSVIDLSYNNGLGKVVQKNIRLLNGPVCDGLAAVKHGNGRDWWVVVKQWNPSGIRDSLYVKYLISPQGISSPYYQKIGFPTITNSLVVEFSKSGEHLSMIDSEANLNLFNFDRCTGMLFNYSNLHYYNGTGSYFFWSACFSPDETKFYITDVLAPPNSSTSYLYQFDLTAPNVWATIDTLAIYQKPILAGALQLGPDDKIYLASYLELNDCEPFYLYCDTSYYPENMHLGVINDPNNLGAACNFQPFSFYLGGKRTYLGLPNNPNYELGPLSGSPCDTLTLAAPALPAKSAEFHVFYHSDYQKAFINGSSLQGTTGRLIVTDLLGHLLIDEPARIENGYYMRSLELPKLAAGVYVASLFTSSGRFTARFVVN